MRRDFLLACLVMSSVALAEDKPVIRQVLRPFPQADINFAPSGRTVLTLKTDHSMVWFKKDGTQVVIENEKELVAALRDFLMSGACTIKR